MHYDLTYTPDTGRVIYRWKGVVKHTGILAGNDQYNRRMVIHNHPDTGYANVVTFEEFAKGQPTYYDDSPCSFSSYEIWLRAIDAVNQGTPYNLLLSNCQHFTSEVCTGKKQSDGLAFWGTLAAVVIGGLLIGSSSER